MASKVSLINVGKDLWSYLCRQIPPPVALSNFSNETQLSDMLRGGSLDADIIVLGHHIKDPLKIANWVKAINPATKIFLLRKPNDYEEMQAEFSNNPALAEGIQLCSTADIKTLPATLINTTHYSANDTHVHLRKPAANQVAAQTLDFTTQSEDIELMDTLFDSADIGFILLDREQTITHVNAFACRLFKLDPRESLGIPIGIVLSTQEQQRKIQQLIHDVQSGRDHSFILLTLRHEEDEAPLHLRISAAPHQPHNLQRGTALIVQDQTDIIASNTLLKEEQLRNKLTLELIKEGVIVTDNQFNIEHMNPIAESLTAWPGYEAIQRPLNDVLRLIDANKRERIQLVLQECLSEKKAISILNDTLLVDRNNSEHSVNLTIAPRIDHEQQPRGLVIIIKDTTETHRLASEIRHHASHDSLTGLLNRQEFEYQLEKAISSATLHNVQHVLCYIDINQFKIINTQAGHTAGDLILKQAAQLLRQKIRSIDVLGRLGGDEFALLLVNHTLEQAQNTANTLLEEFQQHEFIWREQLFELTMCIGMVTVNKDSNDPAQMLTRAELACFSAKERGRNRIQFYRSDDDELTRKHGEIIRAAGITGALQEERFQLYCQPIVSLSSTVSTAQHYELLLRLTDPSGNIILPASFIPAAERYGLMTNVDRWVIHTALHSYFDTFGIQSKVQIAINLSGNSLNDDTLLDFIKQELISSQINPNHVCFEITETAAINNLTQASQLIAELKKLGCRFALDDFGSGLSSFTYLKNLPVDYLKIDGSFVTDMVDDNIDYAMVDAINQLGHVMGIGTIAECAESQEVVDHLRKLGVDFAQGYAMGSPIPMDGLKLLH